MKVRNSPKKDLEDRNLLQEKSLKLEKIMNEKMSKRRIQITDIQKQETRLGRNELSVQIIEAQDLKLIQAQILIDFQLEDNKHKEEEGKRAGEKEMIFQTD